MRIAAGILTIIVGLCTPAIFGQMTGRIVEIVGFEAAIESTQWTILLLFLLLGLTIGGGICAFRRKHWGVALAGAICSVFIGFAMLIFPVFGLIFPPMGILAVIFLTKRKGEFD